MRIEKSDFFIFKDKQVGDQARLAADDARGLKRNQVMKVFSY